MIRRLFFFFIPFCVRLPSLTLRVFVRVSSAVFTVFAQACFRAFCSVEANTNVQSNKQMRHLEEGGSVHSLELTSIAPFSRSVVTGLWEIHCFFFLIDSSLMV